jgi:GNAT superfamily N-acetyltransferase
MSNKYYIRSTRQEDFLAIVNLLQDISLFKPNLNDSNLIWSRFIEQKNVYTLVVIYKDDLYEEVVGYASLSTELKIRGGIMGHIEDVVIHDDHRKNGLGSLLINELLNCFFNIFLKTKNSCRLF